MSYRGLQNQRRRHAQCNLPALHTAAHHAARPLLLILRVWKRRRGLSENCKRRWSFSDKRLPLQVCLPLTFVTNHTYSSLSRQMCRLRRSDSHHEAGLEFQSQNSAQQHVRLDRRLLSRRPSVNSDLITRENTISLLVPYWQADLARELDKCTASASISC